MNVYELKINEYYKSSKKTTDEIIWWRPDEVSELGFYSNRKKALAAFVARCDQELEWHTHWDNNIKVSEIDVDGLKIRIEIGEEAIIFIGEIEKHKVH